MDDSVPHLTDAELEQLMAPLLPARERHQTLFDYLRTLAQMRHVPTVFRLHRGVHFQAQPLPSGIEQGPKKQCFQNASMLAFENRSKYTYVEGWAFSGLLPVDHAWCVDAEGNVVDPTWDNPQDCAYFGIPLDTNFVFKRVQSSECWGVFGEMVPMDIFRTPCRQMIAPKWREQVANRPTNSVMRHLAERMAI